MGLRCRGWQPMNCRIEGKLQPRGSGETEAGGRVGFLSGGHGVSRSQRQSNLSFRYAEFIRAHHQVCWRYEYRSEVERPQ